MSLDVPLVSVVIPLYNGGMYIKSTLESVLSQSYASIEILVVDDGSSDDGPGIVGGMVNRFPDRIRFLRHPDGGNHWIAASRNLAIRNARGQYIAFVDQDDMWAPGKLDTQMEVLHRHPDAGMIYAKTSFIDREGVSQSVGDNQMTGGRGVAGTPRKIFDSIIKDNFIPTLTTVVRKDCLFRVGLFEENSRHEYEDWLLFSKIAYFYDVLFVPEVLARYRLHRANYSRYLSDSGLLQKAEEHYTVTLFSYLMSCQGVDPIQLRRSLRRRIWFFFLRARSWGVSKEELGRYAENLTATFSSEKFMIWGVYRTLSFLPAGLGSGLRRLRRRVVGP